MENQNIQLILLDIKRQNKRRLLWIILLIVLNTLMYTLIVKDLSMTERFVAALSANLVGYNVIGFILGTLVALLPYKNLPYAKKYVRASLLSILMLQSVVAFALLLLLLMTFVGWY